MVVLGDALRLPFADRSFDRVLTGHFYGHLGPDEREAFLREASRVAAEFVVVDSAYVPDWCPSCGRNVCSTTAAATGSTSDTSPPTSSRTRSKARP
jgi:ubiquinone/menaquinone biosynthesis C-methylase UbiE